MEKMYWKVRKIKNDLVFKIKAFLHTRSGPMSRFSTN